MTRVGELMKCVGVVVGSAGWWQQQQPRWNSTFVSGQNKKSGSVELCWAKVSLSLLDGMLPACVLDSQRHTHMNSAGNDDGSSQLSRA